MRQPVAHGRPDVVGRGRTTPAMPATTPSARCSRRSGPAPSCTGWRTARRTTPRPGPFSSGASPTSCRSASCAPASTTSSRSSAGSTPWRNGADRGASAPGLALAASARGRHLLLSVDADPAPSFKNGRSAPAVDVLVADDVVLAEVSRRTALRSGASARRPGSPCDAGRQAARARSDSVPASRSRRPR